MKYPNLKTNCAPAPLLCLSWYLYEDNETAARDCSVVCMCNVKNAAQLQAVEALAVALVDDDPIWGACSCSFCRVAGGL